MDIHPPEWNFPDEPAWVAGWVYGADGQPVADVRAWIDDRPFLGLCGLPRAEIEKRMDGPTGSSHPGFSFLLQPWKGAQRLRLEACGLDGRWTGFFETEITTAKNAQERPKTTAVAEDLPGLLLALLRLCRLHPEYGLRELARETIAARLAVPLDTLPNPPFFGALEEPRDFGRVTHGRLVITGWIAHRTDKIAALTAVADPLNPLPLLHGLPRTDTSRAFAELRDVDRSAFAGFVDLPPRLPLPAAVRVFAGLDDGRSELVFCKRFHPRTMAGTVPVPPFSRRLFVRATLALAAAARHSGVPPGAPAALLAALRNAWKTFRSEAPPARRRPPRRYEKAVSKASGPVRKVVVVTQNLNYEGAPWILFEYVRFLAARTNWKILVVSPLEGPLRSEFEATGARVGIVDPGPVFEANDPGSFDKGVAELSTRLDWQDADLVVANTLMSFWAVHVARDLGIPSIFYIHESAPIHRFFQPFLNPVNLPGVEKSLRLAQRVAFSSASSLAVHRRRSRCGNFRLVSSWIDVERIDRYAAAHDRRELRRGIGIPDDAPVFINVGSVCERKGQHIFIRAVERLREFLAPASTGRAPPRFLMIGARPGPYLQSIRQEVVLRELEHVEFVEETPDPFSWFRMADVFVCSSFEESFPRVLMEAAVFGLPIATTDVNGIAEMLGPEDAWMTEPGNPEQLADAMLGAWQSIEQGDQTRPDRARRRILEHYDARRILPIHLSLAAETMNRRD